MNALVTGAAGFVGANLVRALLHKGEDVTAVVRPGSDEWRLADVAHAIRIERAQLDDEDQTYALLRRTRPQRVFHCAASGGYSWQDDAGTIARSNIVATVHVVMAAMESGVEAFVNTGSSSEYGFRRAASSEDDWPRPNSTYAISKATATSFCRWAAEFHRFPLVTLRLYSVFGPFEEPRRLVPSLIVHGLDKRLAAMASPATARDFVFVDEVCRAYLLAAACASAQPGRIYNIGSGVQTTLKEIVGIVREMLAIPQEPAWGSMASRTWDTDVWQANCERASRELGWNAKRTVREGLELTVAWFRDRPDLLERYRRALSADQRA
jgi:dolichol-phosphate mannosyltransferase